MTSSEAVADWGGSEEAQGQLEEQRAADAPVVPVEVAQAPPMEEKEMLEAVQEMGEPEKGEEEKKEQAKPWSDILDLTLDDYIRQHRPSLLLVRDSDEETQNQEEMEGENKDEEAKEKKEDGQQPQEDGKEGGKAAKKKRARQRGGGGQQKKQWRNWREAQQRIRAYRNRVALTVEAQQAAVRAAQAYQEQDQTWLQASQDPTYVAPPWERQRTRSWTLHERPNSSPLHPNPRRRIRPVMPVLGLQLKASAPAPPVTLTPRMRAMGPTPITPGVPADPPNVLAAQRDADAEGGKADLDRAQAMERVMGGLAALFPPR